MRNRFPQPDENHHIPRDYLRDRCGGFEQIKIRKPTGEVDKKATGITTAYRANWRGLLVIIYDLSKTGGIFPDWLIEVEGKAAWIEVKTEDAYKAKNHSLKAGEILLRDNTELPYFIIANDMMFEQLLETMTY